MRWIPIPSRFFSLLLAFLLPFWRSSAAILSYTRSRLYKYTNYMRARTHLYSIFTHNCCPFRGVWGFFFYASILFRMSCHLFLEWLTYYVFYLFLEKLWDTILLRVGVTLQLFKLDYTCLLITTEATAPRNPLQGLLETQCHHLWIYIDIEEVSRPIDVIVDS